jgi:hypothetical protein
MKWIISVPMYHQLSNSGLTKRVFMTANELLRTLQARDVQLMVEGNQLRYDASEGVITDEVLTLLRKHKVALLELVTASTIDASPVPATYSPMYPCVVCGQTNRWDDHGIWRCRACWPPGSLQRKATASGPDEVSHA